MQDSLIRSALYAAYRETRERDGLVELYERVIQACRRDETRRVSTMLLVPFELHFFCLRVQ